MNLARRQSTSSLHAALCFATAFGISFSPVLAAPKKTKPSAPETAAEPAAKSSGIARLRLWKFADPAVNGEVRIRLLPGEGKSDAGAVPLSSNTNHYEIGNFNDVPAGTVTLEAVVLPDGQPSLFPLHLSVGVGRTVIVHVKPGSAQMEMTDDGLTADDEGKAFNVYNLLPGTKSDVQVSLGEAFSAHVLSPGGSLRVRGIKAALYPISGVGTDGDGKPFRWNGETDLRKTRQTTLIICPDAYGRLRPRVIEDNGEAAPSDKAASGSNG